MSLEMNMTARLVLLFIRSMQEKDQLLFLWCDSNVTGAASFLRVIIRTSGHNLHCIFYWIQHSFTNRIRRTGKSAAKDPNWMGGCPPLHPQTCILLALFCFLLLCRRKHKGWETINAAVEKFRCHSTYKADVGLRDNVWERNYFFISRQVGWIL